MTKWEMDYAATQKIRQETLRRVNTEIKELLEKNTDKN